MPRLLILTAVTAERDAVLAGVAAEPASGRLAGLPVLRAGTRAGLVDVVAGGVGPVAAALSAAALLAAASYDLVIATGIGGGLPPAEVGGLVVADRVTFADLGAELPDGGFAPLSDLGLSEDPSGGLGEGRSGDLGEDPTEDLGEGPSGDLGEDPSEDLGEGSSGGLGQVSLAVDPAVARLLAERTGALTGTVLTVSTVTGSQLRAEQLRVAHPRAVAEAMEGAGVAMAAARAGVRFGELRAISNPVGPRDRASWRLAEALAALARGYEQLLGAPLAAPMTERWQP